MRITAELLRANGACRRQVETFARIWPDGVEPTAAAVERARNEELNVTWTVWLLPEAARDEYDPVRDAAWAEYERATAAARDECNQMLDEARDVYDRVWDAAWAEYRRATAPARAKYERVRDAALVAALASAAEEEQTEGGEG